MDDPSAALTPPTVDGRPVLECSGLRKRYGERTVVDGLSFHIAEGETYGLLGPNGAGKTTAISMLCGLLRRDGGTVAVAGHDLDRELTAVKASIGYVPQDVALYPDLTARENLRFFGRLYGMRGTLLNGRVGEVLEVVGIADRADDRVEHFSGGMKRRLNIAVGLLHRPRLLVLDEPTVGVDPQSRNAILTGVEELGGSGMAVLYTTHYMEEAERLCHRIGIIDDGRLIAEGTRRELIAMVGELDRISLTVSAGELLVLVEACRGLDGVRQATTSAGQVDLLVEGGRRLLPRLIELAEHCGVTVQSVDLIEPDLEAVFLHLTGKALRDR